MGLNPGTIALRFRGGINTKEDYKSVQTTELLVLENGVFTKAVSLVKRNGYEALSQVVLGELAPLTTAKRLAKRGSELISLTDERAFSYVSGRDRWVSSGSVEAPVMTDRVTAKSGTEQANGDSAVLSGVRVVAWEDSRGGVWCSVIDDTSGATIRAETRLNASGERPRVVAAGTTIHVYYAVPASGFLYVVAIDPFDPTLVIAPSILVEISQSKPYYDAEPTTAFNGAPVIAWVATDATYRLGYVNPSGVIGAPANGFPSIVTIAGTSFTAAISVAYDTSAAADTTRIAVSTIDNGQLRNVLHHGTTLALASSTSIAITGGPVRIASVWQRDAGAALGRKLWFVVEYTAASDRDHLAHVGSQEVGGASGFVALQRGTGLASRAFRDGGGVYVWLGMDSLYYSVALCVRLGASAPLQCVARAMPGIWGGLSSRSHLSGVWEGSSSRTHRWTATYQEQLEAESGDQFAESGIRLVDLAWDDKASHQSAELGGCLYLGGGLQRQYDGARWAEAGFHVAPDEIIATPSAGGGLNFRGTYEYVAWYEETLANGEVDRGPTSDTIEVVLTGTQNRVTLTLPMYRLTGRRNVRLCVARSQDGEGGVFNQVTSLDPSAIAGSNRYLANDMTIDTVTLVDDLDDITLLTKPNCYINGGVYPNDPIPGGAIITSGKNRVFVNDPSSPNALFYSKYIAEGLAAEFSPAWRIPIDAYGGAITGIAVMDDTIIVFKESAIYFIAGDGPLANPDLGGGFSAPILITSDVGCSNGRSIESTPEGLVFQTSKGIYLLKRDRSVLYVGAKAEGFNAQTVRSADLIRDTTQVRFLTDDGQTLLYDYRIDQWSTFTNHLGLDAVVVGGRYHYLRTDGRVFRETPGVYSDAGSPITLRIETAWIKPGEILQQYMKVWYAIFIGERKSAHWFRTQWRTNYDVAWSDPEQTEFDARLDPGGVVGAQHDIGWNGGPDLVSEPGGSRYGLGNYGSGPYSGLPGLPVFQWRLHLGQACEAIQFRFEDRQITGQPGPSYELTELLLEVGLKARTFKGAMPDGRSR